MKQFFIILSLLLVTICLSQQKLSRVTLKSGTVVTGSIVELNPATHVTLNVAGFETRIEMTEVASIEEAPSAVKPILGEDTTLVSLGSNHYPPIRIIEIGPYELELILVKGGQYTMGYDGRGSITLRSEPVHDVIVSDFYVCRAPLKTDLVTYLKTGRKNNDTKERSYAANTWRDANRIADSIAVITGLPFQLISEAQWEYMAISNSKSLLEIDHGEIDYCNDFFAKYTQTLTPFVDPTGPSHGRGHVVRRLDEVGPQLYGRSSDQAGLEQRVIRISIPATAFSSAQPPQVR